MKEPEPWPPHRVLVVENDESLLELIGEMLHCCGCESVLARTVQNARSHVETGHFDLVLIDLGREGFVGQDTFRELTELRPELADRVVFMTGVGTDIPRIRAFLARSGRPAINKPFGIDKIESTVKGMTVRAR